MVNIILTIHLMIAVGMIALILMQKTEGNSAGGGFSVSSVSAMMQPRSRPNALSRATTILGICFFVTSLGLALIAKHNGPQGSIIDTAAPGATGAPKVTDILPPAENMPAEAPAPSVPTVPTR